MMSVNLHPPPAVHRFLIDANVIIAAYMSYYPFDKIPQFWRWLRSKCEQGVIKIPSANFQEITPGPETAILAWLRQPKVVRDLVLAEVPSRQLINRVFDEGYGNDLSLDYQEQLMADATLIASAMIGDGEFRTVVTKETSKRGVVTPHKRKIPDVCKTLGVPCISDFELFFKVLDFHIPEST